MELLSIISPYIEKKDTVMRKAISPYERLLATIRFIATGCSYEELKFPTLISAQSLGHIIPETCKAIIQALQQHYMKVRIRYLLIAINRAITLISWLFFDITPELNFV